MRRVLSLFWRRRDDYRATFETPEGKRVLRDLLSVGRVAATVVVPGDPMMTGFNDGMRRMALHITRTMGMSDEQVIALAQQHEGTGYVED